MAYGPQFDRVNVAGNYFAGRDQATSEQQVKKANALADRRIQMEDRRMQQEDAAISAEQKKQLATTMLQAAQYGIQSSNPKAFIEQNYPQIAQLAGDKWAALDDEGVRSQLRDAQGIFGPMAGVGPAAPQEPGPLESYIGDDGQPVYGTRRQAIGRRPYDKPPQVVQQFTPVQTDVGVGAFNSRTGQVTPTGVKAPPKGATQTEADKRAAVMFSSMVNAENQLKGLTGADTSSVGQAVLGSNPATRMMQSDDFRKYEAAGLRWTANLLYLKSGATAPTEEVKSNWKQYFPQPGDGPEVKAQKMVARTQEMDAIAESYKLDGSKIPRAAGSAQSGAKQQGQPVQVRSAQEAAALPSGTVFITPDGRRKVRP